MILSRHILQQFAEAINDSADVQELMALLQITNPLEITIGRIPDIESGELENITSPSIFLALDGDVSHDNQTQEIPVAMAIHIRDDDVSTDTGIRVFEGYRKLEEILQATLTALIVTSYGAQIELTTYSINADKFPVWRLQAGFTLRPQNGLAETLTD